MIQIRAKYAEGDYLDGEHCPGEIQQPSGYVLRKHVWLTFPSSDRDVLNHPFPLDLATAERFRAAVRNATRSKTELTMTLTGIVRADPRIDGYGPGGDAPCAIVVKDVIDFVLGKATGETLHLLKHYERNWGTFHQTMVEILNPGTQLSIDEIERRIVGYTRELPQAKWRHVVFASKPNIDYEFLIDHRRKYAEWVQERKNRRWRGVFVEMLAAEGVGYSIRARLDDGSVREIHRPVDLFSRAFGLGLPLQLLYIRPSSPAPGRLKSEVSLYLMSVDPLMGAQQLALRACRDLVQLWSTVLIRVHVAANPWFGDDPAFPLRPAFDQTEAPEQPPRSLAETLTGEECSKREK
jgi:hypothetical protein